MLNSVGVTDNSRNVAMCVIVDMKYFVNGKQVPDNLSPVLHFACLVPVFHHLPLPNRQTLSQGCHIFIRG